MLEVYVVFTLLFATFHLGLELYEKCSLSSLESLDKRLKLTDNTFAIVWMIATIVIIVYGITVT